MMYYTVMFLSIKKLSFSKIFLITFKVKHIVRIKLWVCEKFLGGETIKNVFSRHFSALKFEKIDKTEIFCVSQIANKKRD